MSSISAAITVLASSRSISDIVERQGTGPKQSVQYVDPIDEVVPRGHFLHAFGGDLLSPFSL